jgi:hypothetical protein
MELSRMISRSFISGWYASPRWGGNTIRPVTINRDLRQKGYVGHEFSCHVLVLFRMISYGVLIFMVAMGNANGVVFEYEKIKRPVTINRDLNQNVEHTIKPVTIIRELGQSKYWPHKTIPARYISITF